jgi:signal transduction histidine kinase
MHCGKIDVDTKEGIGTTFIVKLPINAECVFS